MSSEVVLEGGLVSISTTCDEPPASTSPKSLTSRGLSALESSLVEVETHLEVVHRPELGPLVHWRGNVDLPIHRWYKYREGYSPDLIDELNLGLKILDPFAGSGSIMVGAAQKGLESVGIDVSPLASFIAKVKVTPLPKTQLKSLSKFISNPRRLINSVPWPTPRLRIINKLFEPAILDTLLRIRGAIEEHTDDERTKNFLLLGWISILETVGSYFKEGNGIKYRNRKRGPNGYSVRPEGVWQRERFGEDQVAFTLRAFVSQINLMIADAQTAWHDDEAIWAPQTVHTGSATKVMEHLSSASFDSVIFSPPYANRFDYFEAAKVELWMGGFVSSYAELNALRKESMRSHLGSALGDTTYTNKSLEKLISLMDSQSYAVKTRVPELLRGYFEDMKQVLIECRRVVKENSKTYVVVGNSAYAGVIIPTDSLTAQIGIEAGFENARVNVVRHLTVAPQQREQLRGYERFMRESVIELW